MFVATFLTAPLSIQVSRYLELALDSFDDIAFIGAVLALVTNFLQGIISLGFILGAIYFMVFKPIRKIQKLVGRIATGDLTEDTEKYPKNILGELATDIHIMMKQNRDLLSEIDTLSAELKKNSGNLTVGTSESNQASEHIAKLSQEMVEASNTQSYAIEQVNSDINQAMNKLSEATETTKTLEQQALRAVSDINQGEEQLRNAVEDVNSVKISVNQLESNINELNINIQQINEILEMISNISNQTNLLALNAAIEAARAGEEGRGFAVVADEIRKLSEQTQKFTTDIQGKVELLENKNSQTLEAMKLSNQSVEKGVSSMHNTEIKIKGVLDNTEDVINLAKSLSVEIQNLHKQTMPLIDETQKISEISQNNVKAINEVAASLQEQAAQANEVENIASNLEQYAEKLQGEIRKFRL